MHLTVLCSNVKMMMMMMMMCQERDEWVAAVEKQILSSLQLLESNKSKVCLFSMFAEEFYHCYRGERAFPVAAARAWSSLPPSVQCTSSLASMCLQLKTQPVRCVISSLTLCAILELSFCTLALQQSASVSLKSYSFIHSSTVRCAHAANCHCFILI